MFGLRKVSAGDLGVALALGDQREDLGLAVGEPLVASRPVQPERGARRGAAGR